MKNLSKITEPEDLVTKQYVDDLSTKYSSKIKEWVITLVGSNWDLKNTQVIKTNVKASGFSYICNPAPIDISVYGWAGIYADDVTTDGSITFHCKKIPLNHNIEVRVLEMPLT